MNPSQAPDLPRRQIVAISYAALNPPDAVWRRYLAEIRKLKERGELTEEQVGLLLFSPDARLELMNATSGDPAALATGTIAEILGHAEASARAETEKERDEERAGREEAEEQISAAERRTEAEAERSKAIIVARERRTEKWSVRLAAAGSWLIFGLLALLVLGACASAANGLFPESWSKLIPLGSALVFLLALASAATLIGGWNLLGARRWVARKVLPAAWSVLKRLFEDREEPPFGDGRDR
jgi:hypothetical protein